jgi:hypothetical protein
MASKNAARAWRIYKYLSLIYAVGFLVWMLIDDYVLYSVYWRSAWAMYLQVWFMYLLAYLIIFSFFYWLIAGVVLVVYRKQANHDLRP